MSASNAFETALLNLIFKNLAIANIGDANGLQPSATAGVLYIGLHTADPGEAGAQNTSEISYTGYARVGVIRGSGFTVTNDTVTNAALTQFGLCTAGSGTATHFSIGTASSGAGVLLLSGALTAELEVSNGIQPQFPAGDLSTVVA